MRRFLQTSIFSCVGLVMLLGYQNCTKVKSQASKPIAKGSLSSEWKDIYSKK